MDFIQACQIHGILIDHLPPFGIWKRYPTETHPRKRNGAVKWMGDHGFIQDHARDTEVIVWKGQELPRHDLGQMILKAQQDTLRRQKLASQKAAYILNNSENETHEYINRKGFCNLKVPVFEGKAVIPMRINGALVGCQMISPDGSKRFLSGQVTAGASLTIDNKGMNYLVEGYATALSLRAALKHIGVRYTIHVSFSAGNMAKLAKSLTKGMIIADHDPVGEKIARESGWSYFISGKEGEDFNDLHLRVGLESAAAQLKAKLYGF